MEGLTLKIMREIAGLRQKEVGHRFDWYATKLVYYETGRLGVTKGDFKKLLKLYGFTESDYHSLYCALLGLKK